MFKRILLVGALMATVTGCSTVRGWFGGKDDGKPTEPAALVDFTPTASVTRLWSVNVGKGEDRLGIRQGPSVAEGRVYAAAVSGGVRALDLQTGSQLWHYQSDARISGGPGSGDGLVVVGTLDGEVIALDAATGAERWQAKVSNEVIATPTIGQGVVLVRSNDGRVTTLDAATGERRWFYVSDLPSLTVRGNAPVTLGPAVAFVGNDDGTVAAMALGDGRLLWRQVVGVPDGRTELERMADVDGEVILDGTSLFATSYKNETVSIDGPSGRPLWTRENGGAGGLGRGASAMVVTDPGGTVWSLEKSSGNPLWSNANLVRRSLTGPAVQGEYAVVGDFDGYVHWLRMDDGALAARERVGRKAFKARPVVADGMVLVQNIDGQITAYRLQ